MSENVVSEQSAVDETSTTANESGGVVNESDATVDADDAVVGGEAAAPAAPAAEDEEPDPEPGERDVATETTDDGREYLTYEQFGRRFFEVAVTEERIGSAFTAIAGEEFQVGPIASGPGGVAKVRANVRIAEPEIVRQVDDTISFTVKLPLYIGLVVDLMVDRIRYDVDGLVTLPLTVRCAEPLQLRIEVDTPRPRDVFVDVASHNIRGSIIRYLAQVDDEIRRVIARFVADEVDKPEVQNARFIDVDVELGKAF